MRQCTQSGADSTYVRECSTLAGGTVTNPITCANTDTSNAPVFVPPLGPAVCRRSHYECVSTVSSVSGFDHSVYFPTTAASCNFAPGTTNTDAGTIFASFGGSYARSTGSDSLVLHVPLPQAVTQTVSWQSLLSMGLPIQADLTIGGQVCSGTPIPVPDGAITPTGAAAYTGTVTYNSAGPAWSVTLNLTCPTDSTLNIVGTFSGNQ